MPKRAARLFLSDSFKGEAPDGSLLLLFGDLSLASHLNFTKEASHLQAFLLQSDVFASLTSKGAAQHVGTAPNSFRRLERRIGLPFQCPNSFNQMYPCPVCFLWLYLALTVSGSCLSDASVPTLGIEARPKRSVRCRRFSASLTWKKSIGCALLRIHFTN